MTRKIIPVGGLLLYVLFSFSCQTLVAQHVLVCAKDEPLGSVLLKIHDSCNIEFSFNHEALINYKCTVHKDFGSPEDAVTYLLKDFPLACEKIENTYVIYPDKNKIRQKSRIISGIVQDYHSSEPLPFVSMQINNVSLTTDQLGRYSCKCDVTDSIDVSVSYLGYYQLDTTLQTVDYFVFRLFPRSYQLQEVVLSKSNLKVDHSIVTDEPGKIKINPIIAKAIPGYGDNSLYTCLSLMPGVQVASSAEDGLMVWGIPEDQNNIRFDGIKVFSINRYFKHIGTINPMLIKDIELYKNGGDAQYGDLAGSMINLTSIKGNTKASYTLNLNNTTINTLIELPIKQKSTLVVAARKTYFNLLSPYREESEELNEEQATDTSNNYLVSDKLIPAYRFQDIYAKYSGQTKKNNNYAFSIFCASDKYNIEDENTLNYEAYKFKDKGLNKNLGASVFLGGEYVGDIQTGIQFSYSALKETIDIESSIYSNSQTDEQILEEYLDRYENTFQETALRIDNQLPVSKYQNWQFGIRASHVFSKFSDRQDDSITNIKNTGGKTLSAYIEDNISLTNKFRVIPGIRFSYLPELKKAYPEPRIAAIFSPIDKVKFKFHSGMYAQMAHKEMFIDSWGNVYYYWAIADLDNIKTLKSFVYSFGTALGGNKQMLDIEYYNKIVEGMKVSTATDFVGTDYGTIRTQGIDLFYKLDFTTLSSWLSCSYNQAKVASSGESQFTNTGYQIKWLGIKHFKKMHFSADYTYSFGSQKETNVDYKSNKFDMSAGYNLCFKKLSLEVGMSVLNLFNTKSLTDSYRIKYSYQNDYEINYLQYDLPRTITAYIKMRFVPRK